MKLKICLKSKKKAVKIKNVIEVALLGDNLEIYLLEGSTIPSGLKNYNTERFINPDSATPYHIAIDIPVKEISSYVIQ